MRAEETRGERERERDVRDDDEHYWDNHGSYAPSHHPFRLQAMALPSPFTILPFLFFYLLQGNPPLMIDLYEFL